MTLFLPRGLPARQTRFLCLLVARPSLTRADYQRLLQVSHNTAKRELTELVAARLVLPFGGARTRRYALSPLTLLPLPDSRLPTLDSGPGSGPYLAGSPGQEPPPIGITIDPISLRRP